jgi:hypothetical protein
VLCAFISLVKIRKKAIKKAFILMEHPETIGRGVTESIFLIFINV